MHAKSFYVHKNQCMKILNLSSPVQTIENYKACTPSHTNIAYTSFSNKNLLKLCSITLEAKKMRAKYFLFIFTTPEISKIHYFIKFMKLIKFYWQQHNYNLSRSQLSQNYQFSLTKLLFQRRCHTYQIISSFQAFWTQFLIMKSVIFPFNWNSLHASLNSHYEAWR